jgi:hypothetical protein
VSEELATDLDTHLGRQDGADVTALALHLQQSFDG